MLVTKLSTQRGCWNRLLTNMDTAVLNEQDCPVLVYAGIATMAAHVKRTGAD